MPRFGKTSKRNLLSCHPDLVRLFDEVIKHYDCSIVCGHRGEDEQNALYLSIPPKTKVQYPDSKHNSLPSMAVDACALLSKASLRRETSHLGTRGAFRMIARASVVKVRFLTILLVQLKFGSNIVDHHLSFTLLLFQSFKLSRTGFAKCFEKGV